MSWTQHGRREADAIGPELRPDLAPILLSHNEVFVAGEQFADFIRHAAAQIGRARAKRDDGDIRALAEKSPE
jgi:hypothetical protein